MAALECYADEMRDFPHARSREAATALAKMRGTIQGLGAAEVFVIHRTLGSVRGLSRTDSELLRWHDEHHAPSSRGIFCAGWLKTGLREARIEASLPRMM